MQNKSELLWRGVWGLDIEEIVGPKAGGLVIFTRNMDMNPESGPERLFTLNRGIQELWGQECPIAIAIDQEGGTVSRLKPWIGNTPTFWQVWKDGGAQTCEMWGRLWGRGLGLLGISVNYAPVLDLFDGNEGTGLGQRCASDDPNEVCVAAGAFLKGLESTGVRGCLKHFPGLGGTVVDSHLEMPSIDDPATIAKNMLPFLALAEPTRMIMVSHLKTPTSRDYPASLSKNHVSDNIWGITGRWIPDDMEMGGCNAPDWNTRARLALEAGHMSLLVCQTDETVLEASKAVELLDDSLVSQAINTFRSVRRELMPIPEHFDRDGWKSWIEDVKKASSL
ncbi:MAG: hypothetical protein FWG02_08105 [Holophagaceae bacterium]|nr:hypothetical protein [Holophagaceae bacterium]